MEQFEIVHMNENVGIMWDDPVMGECGYTLPLRGDLIAITDQLLAYYREHRSK